MMRQAGLVVRSSGGRVTALWAGAGTVRARTAHAHTPTPQGAQTRQKVHSSTKLFAVATLAFQTPNH